MPPFAESRGANSVLPSAEQACTLDQLEQLVISRCRLREPSSLASHPRLRNKPTKEHAAVVILNYEKDGEPHILLLHRAAHMRRHANELSLPGGRFDESDGHLLNTATRETEEEVGVSASTGHELRIVGMLPSVYPSLTSLMVVPFVGVMRRCTFHMDRGESQSLLEVPLRALTDKALYFAMQEVRGYRGPLWILPSTLTAGADVRLWGLTARILYDFFAQLDPSWRWAGDELFDTRPVRRPGERVWRDDHDWALDKPAGGAA